MRRTEIHRMILGCTVAILMASSCAWSQGQPAGSRIEGRVVFPGGAPAAGLSAEDVVVYLEGTDHGGAHPGSDGDDVTPVLDQRDLTFVPHVLPVQVGRRVSFHNSDSVLHNIHTVAGKNASFNRAQIANMTFEVTFKKPEVIHVGCDIHSQMGAWIVVLEGPHFTRADRKGQYSIQGVTPGSYTLVAWHEKLGTVKVPVVAQPGSTTAPDLELARARKGETP